MNLDEAGKESSREAANVSSSIAFNSIGLFCAFFLELVLPESSPNVFATVTNLSFLLSAFYIQYKISSQDDEPYTDDPSASSLKDSFMIANLATCACVFMTLLGASSLAFHSNSILFQPSHSFDILFGWLLIVTMAFCSLTASFYAWAGRKLTRQLHATAFVGFLACISTAILFYDTFYLNQIAFYISISSVAVVCAVVSRIVLVGKRPTPTIVGYAVAEILILISLAVIAVFCQGELLGIRLSRESTIDSKDGLYDLFHGLWHYLLSTVASIVFIRSLSVARMVENNQPVCVCSPSRMDVAGEILILIFATVAVVLKESGVPANVSLPVLAATSCALYVHAFATAFL